jgi:hypothetical protein
MIGAAEEVRHFGQRPRCADYQLNFRANCNSRWLVAVGEGSIDAFGIRLPLPSKILVFAPGSLVC